MIPSDSSYQLTTLDNLIYIHNQTHQISFVYDLKRYDIKSPVSVP
jgi:hypothetical protein